MARTFAPFRWLLLPALLSFALASPAHAYLGPGSGLSALGAGLTLLGALFAALFGFVWYPAKRLLRRLRSTDPARERTVAPAAREP